MAKFLEAGGQTQATLNTRNASHNQRLTVRTTTQFDEAMMWSMRSGKDARSMEPAEMIVALVEHYADVMHKHKEEANQCSDSVPPNVRKMLSVAQENIAEAGGKISVKFTTQSRRLARVYPNVMTKANWCYAVDLQDLGKPHCGCHFTEATKFVCEHILAAAAQVPVNDPTILLQDRDKTAFWVSFYAALPSGPLAPSTMDVFQRAPRILLMPATVPNPSGPRVVRRIPNFLERSSHSRSGRSPGAVQNAMGGISKPPRKKRGLGSCKHCGTGVGHYTKSCKVGAGSLLA